MREPRHGSSWHHGQVRHSILMLAVLSLAACDDDGVSCGDETCAEGETCCDLFCNGSNASLTCMPPGMSCGPCVTIDAGRLDAGPPETEDAGPPSTTRSSIRFVRNASMQHEYGLHTVLPPTFGQGEMTLEVFVRLDTSYPVGPTGGGEPQLDNWSDDDQMPYSGGSWWYPGNFLLDGHNNGSGFNEGTFSLQMYGGGRVRWLFGDGEFAGPGGHWSVGVHPANDTPSLLDDAWHRIAMVRRFESNGAILELWIDGARIATENTPSQVDMHTWWDTWPGFPTDQEGWFWGAEKQAAIGALDQYEDYKGLMTELRFWDVARSEADLMTWDRAIVGSEAGLVGYFPFDEGTGNQACDVIDPSRCMTFERWDPSYWVAEGPTLTP